MPHPTFVAAQTDYIARLNDAMRALDRRLASNIVINGDMKVWQRNTSIAGTAARVYTADRWEAVRGAAATGYTVARAASALSGFRYCVRVQRDSGNASTQSLTLAQSFETDDSIAVQGLPLFLTFRARAGANFSSASSLMTAAIVSGTGTDQSVLAGFTGAVTEASSNVTLTTSWQTFTVALATGISTSKNQLAVSFAFTPVGTAGANDYFEVTGVQLVPGNMAGDQIFRPFADELALCRRFYQKSYLYSVFAGGVSSAGALAWVGRVADQLDRINITFGVEMRSAPATVAIYSPVTGTAARVRNVTGAADVTAALADVGSKNMLGYLTANAVANNVYQFHFVADAEL